VLVSCGDGAGGGSGNVNDIGGGGSVTYSGADGDGTTYQLEIIGDSGRYAAKTGDRYVLTVNPGNKTSTGRVTISGSTLTLNPSKGETFTVTITIGGGIGNISGTITFDDGTPFTAPVSITPNVWKNKTVTKSGVNVTAPNDNDVKIVFTGDTYEYYIYNASKTKWVLEASGDYTYNTPKGDVYYIVDREKIKDKDYIEKFKKDFEALIEDDDVLEKVYNNWADEDDTDGLIDVEWNWPLYEYLQKDSKYFGVFYQVEEGLGSSYSGTSTKYLAEKGYAGTDAWSDYIEDNYLTKQVNIWKFTFDSTGKLILTN
jgi:hypothetical protein